MAGLLELLMGKGGNPAVTRPAGLMQPVTNAPAPFNPFGQKPGPFDIQVPVSNQTAAPEPTEIVVTGNIGQQEGAYRPEVFDVPDRPEVDPRYVLNDARVPPHEEDLREVVPRKGMFGVKGTLRDVLGTLGDAFLVQSGNNPMYRPQREKEKMGDAMLGFGENPLQAIERLAALGYTEEAVELKDAYEQAELKKAQIESLDANRKSQAENRDFDNREKGFDRISRWVKGGMPYDRLLVGAAYYGIDADDLAGLGITPDMTPEDRQAFAAGDMTVNQQEGWPRRDRALDQGDRRIGIAQQNAETSRISATRPRAGRAQTDSERYVQIMNKPENERSRGEQAWAERYRNGTRRNNSRRSLRGSNSSTQETPAASRFRPIR